SARAGRLLRKKPASAAEPVRGRLKFEPAFSQAARPRQGFTRSVTATRTPSREATTGMAWQMRAQEVHGCRSKSVLCGAGSQRRVDLASCSAARADADDGVSLGGCS